MRYGRPTTHTDPPPNTAPWLVLALGTALLAGFFFAAVLPPDKAAPTTVDAVPVMQLVREEVSVVEEPVLVEPFGTFQGQWNLWEYIGDLLWSFLA